MRIDELADDYLTAVNSAINQLQSELAVKNLLDAWLQRRIPQRGTLEDGASFQFHGIGCAVERTDDIDVDFDFNYAVTTFCSGFVLMTGTSKIGFINS